MRVNVKPLQNKLMLCLIFLGANLNGMGMDPSSSHNHNKEFVHVPLTTNTPSMQPSHQFYQPHYFNPLEPQSNSIVEASTSQFSNHPDPLMADLLTLQEQGNKKGILEIKKKLEQDLSDTWFGNKAIEEQITKVDDILNSRMTELLWVVHNGTREQALEAIKEIRRLSPYKYAPERGQQSSQIYNLKLQTHLKKSGFDELSAAERLFMTRNTPIYSEEEPSSVELGTEIPLDPANDTSTHVATEEYTKQFYEFLAKLDEQEYQNLTEDKLVSFIEGIVKGSIQTTSFIAQYPDEHVMNIVNGNIELIKSVSSFLYDAFSMPEGPFADPIQLKEYEDRMAARIETVVKIYTAAKEKIAVMDSEAYGNLIGNLSIHIAVNQLGAQMVGSGASALARLTDSTLEGGPFLNGIQQRLASFAENPQAITSAGVALDIETVTDISSAAGEISNAATQATKGLLATGDAVNTLNLDNEKVQGGSNSTSSKYTFKNGKYEDADYHTSKGNTVKSAKPIDGQDALDKSFKFKDSSKSRIALSNDQFVVLMETSPGLYHGHIREWKDLNIYMQNALKKAGLVKPNGKIIK